MRAISSLAVLLAGSALWASAAQAQSGVGNTTGVQDDNPQREAERARDEAATGEQNVGDIVVTAQRRSERLSEVPIAITALSGDTLEETGVSGSLGLTLVTPGLNFVVQGAYAQPTIRGIGTSITGAGADANVAIYIDGVYQPSQVANVLEFNNIERVEVLKGPQGTLFGRNATGGAITVTTAKPSHNAHANLNVGYGSFDEFKVSGYGTAGLADGVAADIAILYSDDRGFTRNITTGNRLSEATAFAVRSKLLLEPTADLSFTLIGNYSDNRDNSTYVTRPINGNNQYFRTMPGTFAPADIRLVNNDTDPIANSETWSVALLGSYDVGKGTLSSITSYQKSDILIRVDSDVTSLPISTATTFLPQKTFSQELNFASDFGEGINFIAGLFYYDDKAGRTSITSRGVGGAVTQNFNVDVDTEALAAYGEFTFDASDSLHFVAGIRYSSETKSALGRYTVGPATVLNVEETFKAWTPRAAVRYEIDGSNNIYATYSRGFKSGIFNTTSLNDPSPVNPEFVDAYEVGYKLSSRGVSLNTSAFYYDYKDIQVGIQTNVGGIPAGVIQNAASAEIYGADADVTVALDSRWNLRAGVAYTHGRYAAFPNALVTTPIAGGGNLQVPGNATGKDLIRTPEFTANATLSYKAPLMGGQFEGSGTVSYNSGFFFDPGNRVAQDEYALLNGRLSWLTPDDKYRIAIWATNLTDTEYYYYASVSSSGDSASFQRPRSVGVSLSAYFR